MEKSPGSEYLTVEELEQDLYEATGNKALAKQRAHQFSIAYRNEIIETVRYRRGHIDEKAFRLSRNIIWQHAEYHSRRLEKNMAEVGRQKPGNTATHHIVAWDHPRAARARIRLAAYAIDIDHEANGVYLPRFRCHTPMPCMPDAYPHSTIHTQYYFLNVEHLLEDTIANGMGREDIIETLRDVAEFLEDGTFPINEKINDARI